jgi:hypothetical protein
MCSPSHSFGHKKAGDQLEVVPWRAHGDRYGLCFPGIGRVIAELNLQRFLDRECVFRRMGGYLAYSLDECFYVSSTHLVL